MKKFTLSLIATMAVLTAMAQDKVYLYQTDGNIIECAISNFDSLSFTAPTPITSVTDICGNNYKVVTIGTQTWMAENLKCNKYDTKSGAYNASWLENNQIPTSKTTSYYPYYADATDKANWSSSEKAGNLSSEQIKKLGYLYNWAAAVGVANGELQVSDFVLKRQGICPNGWHIPTRDEWITLSNFIGEYSVAGKHLKTTTGWYSGTGIDTYGFSALPAGSAKGNTIENIGAYTYFWAADYYDVERSYDRVISYLLSEFLDVNAPKINANAVRCLKDNTSETIAEPIADFSYSIEQPLSVKLHNKSTGATSYQWSFMDETTSTEKNPTHRFASSGSYYIELTAQNEIGKTSNKLTLITVKNPTRIYVSCFEIDGVLPYENKYYKITLTNDDSKTLTSTNPVQLHSILLPVKFTLKEPVELDELTENEYYKMNLFYSSSENGSYTKVASFKMTKDQILEYPEKLTGTSDNAKVSTFFSYY